MLSSFRIEVRKISLLGYNLFFLSPLFRYTIQTMICYIQNFQTWIAFRYLITNFGRKIQKIATYFLILKYRKSVSFSLHFYLFIYLFKSFYEALVLKLGKVLTPIYLSENFQ